MQSDPSVKPDPASSGGMSAQLATPPMTEAEAQVYDAIFKDIDAIMARVDKKLAAQQTSMNDLVRRLNRHAA